MQNLKYLFLIFLCTHSTISHAYIPKEGNVTANLGPYIYKTNFRGSPSGARSNVRGDIGLLVNGDINDKGALEIGMFHMNKLYFREDGGQYLAEETDLIHMTMGYRRYLSNLFSASLALYSAYSLNEPRIVHSDFLPGKEIDTSARDTTEYGLDIALQYEIWQQDRFSAVADLRYAYSVTNKFSERADHYGVFICLRYFVQDKERQDKDKDKDKGKAKN